MVFGYQKYQWLSLININVLKIMLQSFESKCIKLY